MKSCKGSPNDPLVYFPVFPISQLWPGCLEKRLLIVEVSYFELKCVFQILFVNF